MIRLPRFALTAFALAFGLYHAVLGALNYFNYDRPIYAVLAIVIYLAALTWTLLDRPGLRLKSGLAYLNFSVALIVPLLMATAIEAQYFSGYATWHVAGIATLMAITAVRQHRILAWISVSIAVIEVLVWGGLDILFNSGVIGAVMLVAAASAAAQVLASSERAGNEFRVQELENRAATAAKTAARRERQGRVAMALQAALPQLQLIVARRGKLTLSQRTESVLIEGNLRDQIRGRMLVSPTLSQEVRAARSRGIEVQLLDDGGLDGLSEGKRLDMLNQVALHLKTVKGGKVVIRAVEGEKWRITVAALRKESESPDLFVRL
ncbi:MAG: hypothetical protein RL696_143 [Actinomycetota bacterium]|jgi:hypothetical protein